jgi:hypothetical protein
LQLFASLLCITILFQPIEKLKRGDLSEDLHLTFEYRKTPVHLEGDSWRENTVVQMFNDDIALVSFSKFSHASLLTSVFKVYCLTKTEGGQNWYQTSVASCWLVKKYLSGNYCDFLMPADAKQKIHSLIFGR